MIKLLTTGQMVDALNIGEFAEDDKGFKVTFREKDGILVNEYGGKVDFHKTVGGDDRKWRILPEFVSFDEAYKARKEGKRVLIHSNDRKVLFMTDIKLEGCYLGILTLDELVNGKFTIEGGK